MKQLFTILLCTLLLTGCATGQAESTSQQNSAVQGTGQQSDAQQSTDQSPAYQQITMAEAATMMEEEENYILLDVRTVEEYNEKHIPSAICIPNETIGEDEIAELPDKEQLILVYCRSGNRSKQAAQKLANLGYINIVEIGGIKDWTGDTIGTQDN